MWTSSTITVSTDSSVFAAFSDVSMRNCDSGVVMRTSGGRFSSRFRSRCEVSPVRRAVVMWTFGSSARIPASGTSRFRWMSLPRARRGEMYRTRTPSVSRGSPASLSRKTRNAASVLPDPVGATTSAFRPSARAGQASSWAGVGSPNSRSNHSRAVGLRTERASGVMNR